MLSYFQFAFKRLTSKSTNDPHYAVSLCNFLLCAFLLCGLAGCSGAAKPNTTKNNSTGKNEQQRLCETQFRNIFTVVDIENLETPVQRSTGSHFLNKWRISCQENSVSTLTDSSTELLRKSLSKKAFDRLIQKEFDDRDVTHLRDSTLFKKIATNIVKGAKTDLEKVMRLYYYTTRNITLAPTFASRLPRSPYESILFSLGGLEDRAWVFSILLRQIHIDSVIVKPISNSKDSDLPYLVGVPIDGELYLFEPEFGVPVAPSFAQDKKPFVSRPATLKELRKDKNLLSQFTLKKEAPYPLIDADFSKVRLELIGDTSLWAPRMEPIELSLTRNEQCDLYTAFGNKGTESETSLLIRILKNGTLKKEKVTWGVWEFPETMLSRYENPTEEEKKIIAQAKRLFDHVEVTKHEDSHSKEDNKILAFERRSKSFLKARIKQLIGEYDEAIPPYLKFQFQGISITEAIQKNKIPKNIKANEIPLFIEMGTQAHYWKGLCQYEEKNYSAVINTMTNFRIQQPRQSPYHAFAIQAIAFSLAQKNQLADAVENLNEISKTLNSSERKMVQYYANRWEKLAEKKVVPSAKKSPLKTSPAKSKK